MKLLILNLVIVTQAFAAEAGKAPKAFISKEATFFSRATLSIDGKTYETSFWRNQFEVTDAVKSNKQAYVSALQYEKHMERSSLYGWGGLGLAIAYLFSTDRDNYSDTIYWGVFGTGLGLSLYERHRAGKNLTNMINFYNADF
jgi:hypothetical protein